MNVQIKVNYPAEHEGQIQTVDGLIDKETCVSLLARMDSLWNESFPGKTMGGVEPTTKLTNDLHYSPDAINWTFEDAVLDTTVVAALTSAIAIYRQAYPHLNHWVDITDSGFQVQKYSKSQGYYREHTDSFPGTANERVLAAIIYLNDVEYGGETNFPVHGVRVKPVQGRICLFPAVFTHPHESCVPITGDKWIISTFINNAKTTDNGLYHDGHTSYDNDEPHLHDEHGNHPHEEFPPLILGQAITKVTDGES